MTPEEQDCYDALRAERDELQRKVEELRNALACEMDDTRNACGALNAEIERIRAERDEAVALLLEQMPERSMWHHIEAGSWRARVRAFLAKVTP